MQLVKKKLFAIILLISISLNVLTLGFIFKEQDKKYRFIKYVYTAATDEVSYNLQKIDKDILRKDIDTLDKEYTSQFFYDTALNLTLCETFFRCVYLLDNNFDSEIKYLNRYLIYLGEKALENKDDQILEENDIQTLKKLIYLGEKLGRWKSASIVVKSKSFKKYPHEFYKNILDEIEKICTKKYESIKNISF